MCDFCEEIGEVKILKTAESPFMYQAAVPFLYQAAVFLDLAMTRKDRWSAELQAWATIKGKTTGEPFLIAKQPINYCPLCGRRLSLGAAERHKEDE